MATVKWSALTDRGTVLSPGAVANGGFQALGSAYDNTVNLDRWGWVELSLGTATTTAGACIYVYMAPSLDGTDYDDGPSSTNPASHLLVAVLQVNVGGGAKKVVSLAPFPLPPGFVKFSIKNQTGAALNGTNTLVLFTANETVG